MYKTVIYFEDLQDNNYPYKPGDKFPRKGMKVTKARYAELSGTGNRRGVPLIAEVVKDADADLPVPEKLVQPKTRRKRLS